MPVKLGNRTVADRDSPDPGGGQQITRETPRRRAAMQPLPQGLSLGVGRGAVARKLQLDDARAHADLPRHPHVSPVGTALEERRVDQSLSIQKRSIEHARTLDAERAARRVCGPHGTRSC
jgi:hypothetical protein